ncbi:hypothetical protein J6590_027669 [Homalodisca vitripennis]|nr:hypothetical protein J6590_027669 [Homalodisca vitripennis]
MRISPATKSTAGCGLVLSPSLVYSTLDGKRPPISRNCTAAQSASTFLLPEVTSQFRHFHSEDPVEGDVSHVHYQDIALRSSCRDIHPAWSFGYRICQLPATYTMAVKLSATYK